MDTALLVPLSVVLGLVVGAGFVLVLLVAARRGASAAHVASPTVPDGVDQVLDALESSGVVLDASNNVVKASPGARATGLVRNQSLTHPELVAMVDRVRRSGNAEAEELELARGPFGAAQVNLGVRVARLGSRYVVLLADDRTESYRLDSVRRDFVANISHELKTPIGAVSLLAEALESAAGDPDQVRRFAQRLTEESTRLGRMTQDIIELSRLQAADAVVKPELVSIDRIVGTAIDQNRVPAQACSVEIVSGPGSGAEVYGDKGMLTMAVHNLIANAIQFSTTGSRVGVGVRTADGTVEIVVTDQGEGIPVEDLDRVFERFFRVDHARSRNTGGTGLGLAIVKHAVANHGGDVRVWSQPGRGSTFTIRLPEAAHRPAKPEVLEKKI